MTSRVVNIQGVKVYLDALTSIAHNCDPALCAHRPCCCSYYDVEVSEQELSNIIGLLPAASQLTALPADGDVFEEEDSELVLLRHEHSGDCIFLYHNSAGVPLCSIHAAAARKKLNPYQLKPSSCSTWPLMFNPATGQQALAVVPDALCFPCNRPRRAKKSLHVGIIDILDAVFGENFRKEIQQALRN